MLEPHPCPPLHSWLLAATALAALLAPAAPLHAVDGVIELDTNRMTAGIPAIGDAPGPPLTIGQPGSYVLTGDLFTTGENQNVVEISADHVTLDLNGFAVRCLFALTPCKGNGSGIGIVVSGSNVTIRNGTVRDMASTGVFSNASQLVVKDLRVMGNGDDGIRAAHGALVEGCVVAENGTDDTGSGISVASSSIVRQSVARDNATDIGIVGQEGTVIEGSTAFGHTFGISCRECTIRGNATYGNGTGIQGNDSLVKDNAVTQNGVGITGSRAQVIDNRIVDNTSFGIGSAGAYGGNVLTGNNGGQEVQSNAPGAELATNFCGSDTVCP